MKTISSIILNCLFLTQKSSADENPTKQRSKRQIGSAYDPTFNFLSRGQYSFLPYPLYLYSPSILQQCRNGDNIWSTDFSYKKISSCGRECVDERILVMQIEGMIEELLREKGTESDDSVTTTTTTTTTEETSTIASTKNRGLVSFDQKLSIILLMIGIIWAFWFFNFSKNYFFFIFFIFVLFRRSTNTCNLKKSKL